MLNTSKCPNILNWLEVWSYELAMVKWGYHDPEKIDGHPVFHLGGLLQVVPVIALDERYDEYMAQMLTDKQANVYLSEFMDLSFRVCAKLDYAGVVAELESLVKQLEMTFKQMGFTGFNLSDPLKTFMVLERLFAVEVSAKIAAYAPEKHNPVLGPLAPLIEEYLADLTKNKAVK